jgi:hypothetical protein
MRVIKMAGNRLAACFKYQYTVCAPVFWSLSLDIAVIAFTIWQFLESGRLSDLAHGATVWMDQPVPAVVL